MLNSFIRQLSNLEPNYREIHFGLAVSGGVDSMVLYDLFRKAGLQLTLLHCNFNLRGPESTGDADLVRTEAARYGTNFLEKSFAKKHFDSEGSTQMIARELRYNWFESLVEDGVVDCFVTAHHADDQIETMLLNLIRGTGVRGLAGMPDRTNILLRPLLNHTKNAILEYAEQNGVAYRVDSSNSSGQYIRNRVRNEVLPMLRNIKPGLDNRLKENADIFRKEADALEEYITILTSKYIQWNNGEEFLIPMNESEHTQRLVLRKWLLPNSFTEQDVVSVFHWLSAGIPTGTVLESDTHELYAERGGFRLVRTNSGPQPITIPSEGRYSNGLMELEVSSTTHFTGFKRGLEVLDAGLVAFPLTWRKWKNGDRFKPLGLAGTKLVSDFLTDLKVEPAARNNQTVLTDSTGKIIGIPGLRADDRFKVTGDTSIFLKIELTEK